jgi:hypothetical protein
MTKVPRKLSVASGTYSIYEMVQRKLSAASGFLDETVSSCQLFQVFFYMIWFPGKLPAIRDVW